MQPCTSNLQKPGNIVDNHSSRCLGNADNSKNSTPLPGIIVPIHSNLCSVIRCTHNIQKLMYPDALKIFTDVPDFLTSAPDHQLFLWCTHADRVRSGRIPLTGLSSLSVQGQQPSPVTTESRKRILQVQYMLKAVCSQGLMGRVCYFSNVLWG